MISKSEVSDRSSLTGIERDLVLRYLSDGEVELYISALNLNTVTVKTSLLKSNAKFFSDYVELSNDFRLEAFLGRRISVSFYFQKLGLRFESSIRKNNSNYLIEIPQKLFKIQDNSEQDKNSVQITLIYNPSEKNSGEMKCNLTPDFPLFKKPELTDVTPSNLKLVRDFVETSVRNLRNENKTAGNGLFLIPVAEYLLRSESENICSINGRINSPYVIYLDSDFLILASQKKDMFLSESDICSAVVSFNLPGPVKSRILKFKFQVEVLYENVERTKLCASCKIIEIKEEDKRLLSEKMSES